jgi:hypothetical protein
MLSLFNYSERKYPLNFHRSSGTNTNAPEISLENRNDFVYTYIIEKIKCIGVDSNPINVNAFIKVFFQ